MISRKAPRRPAPHSISSRFQFFPFWYQRELKLWTSEWMEYVRRASLCVARCALDPAGRCVMDALQRDVGRSSQISQARRLMGPWRLSDTAQGPTPGSTATWCVRKFRRTDLHLVSRFVEAPGQLNPTSAALRILYHSRNSPAHGQTFPNPWVNQSSTSPPNPTFARELRTYLCCALEQLH